MKIKLFDLLMTMETNEMIRIETKIDKKDLLVFRGMVADIPRYVWTKLNGKQRVYAYVKSLYTLESVFNKGLEIVISVEYM